MIDTTKRISKVTYNGRNIPVGPAKAKVEEKDVTFIDFDGTILYSYTKEQAMALSALPDPPDHSDNEVPLTFDEWNWTLDQIKTQISEYGGNAIVGAVYHPTDGNTHLFIEIKDINRRTFAIGYSGGTCDWGDGTQDNLKSHTYDSCGTYEIKFSRGVTRFGGETGNGYVIKRIYTNDNFTYLNGDAVKRCCNLELFSMSKGLLGINGNAFDTCVSLKTIIIPSTPSIYRGNEFTGNSGFKTISIPVGTTRMYWSFSYLKSLKNVSIPYSVTNIDSYSFDGCLSLEKITIPSSVTAIGSSAFTICFPIITMKGTTPPTIQSNTFQSGTPRIIVPKGCLEVYQNATNWSSFADVMIEADE